jgi:hypothetical protein
MMKKARAAPRACLRGELDIVRVVCVSREVGGTSERVLTARPFTDVLPSKFTTVLLQKNKIIRVKDCLLLIELDIFVNPISRVESANSECLVEVGSPVVVASLATCGASSKGGREARGRSGGKKAQ